jgi:ATP-dependent Clp protease adaptor protein ClpS
MGGSFRSCRAALARHEAGASSPVASRPSGCDGPIIPARPRAGQLTCGPLAVDLPYTLPQNAAGYNLGQPPTMSDTAATLDRPAAKPRADQKPKQQPPYHVVLLDDDDHTYQYVIEMLQKIFGYPPEKGFRMAREVDTTGRVIVLTTTKEHAELKRDQIMSNGPDARIANCKGAMTAIIEPAEDQ